MASFLFENIKTGETKVINSKDSKQAHKYETKNWKYVKAVPKTAATKQSKTESTQSCDSEVWSKLCSLASISKRIENYAEDYDLKGLRPLYFEMQTLVAQLQKKFR